MSDTTNGAAEGVPTPAPKKVAPPRYEDRVGIVADFISDGYQMIAEVGEEFREIYDNAPENLQQSDVNQQRDATASEIENFSEPQVSSSILNDLECTARLDIRPSKRGPSRATRANNGAALLRAAADALNEWLENNDELPEADTDSVESLRERADKLEQLELAGFDIDDYEAARNEVEDLARECEDIADAVENLSFPGMYG